MNTLTGRQQIVLSFIVEQIEGSGFPPTIREIRDAIGVSSLRGVTVHLDALERKGYIERNSKARGLRVLRTGEVGRRATHIRIPLVGAIAAGTPILAQENIEKYVRVKRDHLRGAQKAFLLRVEGDSMIDAGIDDGDLALMSETNTAQSGDVVAALLNDGVTLKTFHQVDKYIALLPANPKYEPIIGKEFSIQGKMVTLLKESMLFEDEGWADGDLLPVSSARRQRMQWVFGKKSL